jgi:periplasmic divalent cation tolerance protein
MLMIGYTTVATRDEAMALARGLIETQLAACVQIDGPITSVYAWAGKLEQSEEFRLSVKFLEFRANEVKTHVLARHSYETPEWITVRAENVSEKYLSWVKASSSN